MNFLIPNWNRLAAVGLLACGLAGFGVSGLGVPGARAQDMSGVQSANLPDIAVQTPPLTARMQPVPDEAPAPVKREGPLNVHVFGDSLGDGIWAGLYRLLPKADGYTVTKHSRVSTGLVRRDYYNWSKAVRQIVAKNRVDVAIVMIGTNDRQTIVESGRHALRSAGWTEIYKARIDDMTQVLKDEGAQVYWVELPAMRSPRFGGDMQYFNSLFRERAQANGITFVPTWNRMLDSNGNYSAYGEDETGRTRLMRANDGIHFTMRGYIKLASFVTTAMEHAKAAPASTPPAIAPLVEHQAPVIDHPGAVAEPGAPVAPAAPLKPVVDVPVPMKRPGDDRAAMLGEEDSNRSDRAGLSDMASSIASALSDLRGFVMPEPKPGRADDLRQPGG